VVQAASLNHAGNMPPKYIEAVVSGQAIAGVLSSVAAIISSAVTSDQATSAMCFFIIASVISLFVTFAYYILLKNEYFNTFQLNPYANDATSGVQNDEFEESQNKGWCWFIQNLWSELFAVFLTPFITLALFPGLVAQIRSSSNNEVWAEQYFISVITFLVFNIFDYVGRLITNFEAVRNYSMYFIWKSRTGIGALFYSLIRIIFLFMFPLCNVDGKSESIPTYFPEDWQYTLWMIFFAATHGYLTSMVFILVPEKLKNQKLSNSDISNGNYILFMVYSIGLVAGSGAAFGVKYIVTQSL